MSYANPSLTVELRDQINLQVILGTIAVVDTYLLSAVMMIFGFGLYELFVGRIHMMQNSPFAVRLLRIESIEDLKNRLARVVLLVLIVKFSQVALGLSYENPLDLLTLAGGILAIGGALYLSNHAS